MWENFVANLKRNIPLTKLTETLEPPRFPPYVRPSVRLWINHGRGVFCGRAGLGCSCIVMT